MAIIKSFISAISLYSKIPMPNLHYKEGEDRLSIAFFPVVGLLIGLIIYLVSSTDIFLGLDPVVRGILILLIPVIVTGGMHLDGFMDTMDAVSSYQSRERRLQILEDPHIGAFSVIKLMELIGIWLVAAICLPSNLYGLLAIGFVVSRAMSALALLVFPLAKEKGMLAYTRTHASKIACIAMLVAWLLLSTFIAIYFYGVMGIVPLIVLFLAFYYYRWKAMRDFGGISGDLAGCFLVMAETAWILILMILGFIF